MFFITYALLEIPSNVVLKLMRPSRWLAIMVIAWGTVGRPGIVQIDYLLISDFPGLYLYRSRARLQKSTRLPSDARCRRSRVLSRCHFPHQ